MQVNEIIGNEASFFAISTLCGMGLVLVYDILRIFRRIVIHGNLWVGIEDICYWCFCTIVVFLLLYQKNAGMLRAFAFFGILVGGAIYSFLFSKFVVKICVKILETVLKFSGKVLGTVLSPFARIGKKILLFVAKWLKKLYKTIRMGLCKL